MTNICTDYTTIRKTENLTLMATSIDYSNSLIRSLKHHVQANFCKCVFLNLPKTGNLEAIMIIHIFLEYVQLNTV